MRYATPHFEHCKQIVNDPTPCSLLTLISCPHFGHFGLANKCEPRRFVGHVVRFPSLERPAKRSKAISFSNGDAHHSLYSRPYTPVEIQSVIRNSTLRDLY